MLASSLNVVYSNMSVLSPSINIDEVRAFEIKKNLEHQRDRIINLIEDGEKEVISWKQNTVQKPLELAYADRLKIFVDKYCDFVHMWYAAHILVNEHKDCIFNGNPEIFITNDIKIVISGEDFVFNKIEKMLKYYKMGQKSIQRPSAFEDLAKHFKLRDRHLRKTNAQEIMVENDSIRNEKIWINELTDYVGRLNWFISNMIRGTNTTNFGLLQSAKTKGQVISGLFTPMFARISYNTLLFSHIMTLNLKSHEKQFNTVLTLMSYIIDNIILYSVNPKSNFGENNPISREDIILECENRIKSGREKTDDQDLLKITDTSDPKKLFLPKTDDPSLTVKEKVKLEKLHAVHETESLEEIILCKKGYSNKMNVHIPGISLCLNTSNSIRDAGGELEFPIVAKTMQIVDETQQAMSVDGQWHKLHDRMKVYGCEPVTAWFSATIWHHAYTGSTLEGFERAAFGVVGEDGVHLSSKVCGKVAGLLYRRLASREMEGLEKKRPRTVSY